MSDSEKRRTRRVAARLRRLGIRGADPVDAEIREIKDRLAS